MYRVLFLLVLVFNICDRFVKSVSFMEDVRITKEQKLAIDHLRQLVQPYIVEPYMQDDIYLVKFLRSINFDLEQTQRKIIENIRWRNETRIAKIEEEDFSDMESDFPLLDSGYDKEGRPVVIGFASDWNIRSAVVTGRARRLLRLLDRMMEMSARKIRRFQNEGKNVTQMLLIIELTQWPIVTHGCVPCLAATLEFVHSYESHFPGLADKIIFLNAPPAVQFVIRLVRQNQGKVSNDAIKVYGTNKEEWERVLLRQVDKKYLPVELGGYLVRQ